MSKKDAAPATGAKDVDWIKVEVHYRAAVRSLKDIGAEFGISAGRISQKAKELGWVRDLAPKIRAAAEAKMAKEVAVEAAKQESLNDPAKRAARRLTEEAVIDANSDTQVAIIRSHKRSLSVQARLRDKLFQQVELMIDNADVLREYVESIDESGPNENGTWVVDRKAQMMQAILESPEVAKTLKVLSEVDERVRKGEREAYGIDKVKDEKTNIEELLDRVRGDMKAGR